MIKPPRVCRPLAVALAVLLAGQVAAPAVVLAHDFAVPGGTPPSTPPRPAGGQPPSGNPSQDDAENSKDTDPVDIHRGDYILDRQDVYLVGRGLPLDLTFTYRSRSAQNGPYGYGWDMSYHRRVRKLINNNVVVRYGDGRQEEFADAGSGNYTAPPGIYDTLVRNGDGTYTLTAKHGQKEFYDLNGLLTRLEDRHGNALTFTYETDGAALVTWPLIGSSDYLVIATTFLIARDYRLSRITDAIGRNVDFAYTPEGRLASLSYEGRTITYAYDPSNNGDLLGVTLPATPEFPTGSATTYAYTNHNLTTITDANGQPYLTNVYNSDGRLIEQTYGNGTSTLVYTTALECPATAGSGPPGYQLAVQPLALGTNQQGALTWSVPAERASHPTDRIGFCKADGTNPCAILFQAQAVNGVVNGSRTFTANFGSGLFEARYLPDGGTLATARSNTFCTGATALVPGSASRVDITDRNGFVTRYDFDSAGHITRIEQFTDGDPIGEPISYVTQYEYDANGNRTRLVYPKGNAVEFAYDAKGNLLEVRRKEVGATPHVNDPDDLVTTLTYEAQFNFPKTYTDPRGNTTTYTYDYELSEPAQGRLRRITWPMVDGLPIEATFTYNSIGQVETITDPNGFITQYTYHPTTGYPSQVTRGFGTAEAATRGFARDAVGNITAVTDPRGNTTTFAHNARNQLTQATAPAPFSFATHYVYDANGNVIHIDRQAKTTAPGPRPSPGTTSAIDDWESTVYTYTDRDELTSLTDDLAHTTAFTYDGTGNLQTVTDAKNQTTTYDYDERDLLASITDAALPAGLTAYAYDLNGSLALRRDAEGHETAYVYDDFDRLTRMVYADGSDEEYGYDAASNLTSLMTPANQSIAYTYDALNRLRTKVTPEETTTYTYDVSSRLTAAVDADVNLAYAYDALNRVTQVTTDPAGALAATTVGYLYDTASNRTRLTYPDASFITYTYDQLNRLDLIRNAGGATIADFGFDALSRRNSLLLANGVNTTYTYDAASRLTQISSSVATRTYTYDNIDQPLTMGDGTGTHTYGYNARNELTAADAPAGFPFADAAFTYDQVGNRTQVSQGGVTSYTPNNLNQYTTVGAAAITHDANGNLTSDGTLTYTFDSENRLLTATGPSLTASYTYDPFGRRLAKTINGTPTRFLYAGPHIVQETDGVGVAQASYVFGPGLDHPLRLVRGAATHYFHADRLGSIVALSTTTGAVAETFRYDPFGRPATPSSLGNPFLFTGREYDQETGLYYYRARYYEPQMGRFLSRDPLGYLPDESLYRYVENNPTTWRDPWGLMAMGGGPGLGGLGGFGGGMGGLPGGQGTGGKSPTPGNQGSGLGNGGGSPGLGDTPGLPPYPGDHGPQPQDPDSPSPTYDAASGGNQNKGLSNNVRNFLWGLVLLLFGESNPWDRDPDDDPKPGKTRQEQEYDPGSDPNRPNFPPMRR